MSVWIQVNRGIIGKCWLKNVKIKRFGNTFSAWMRLCCQARNRAWRVFALYIAAVWWHHYLPMSLMFDGNSNWFTEQFKLICWAIQIDLLSNSNWFAEEFQWICWVNSMNLLRNFNEFAEEFQWICWGMCLLLCCKAVVVSRLCGFWKMTWKRLFYALLCHVGVEDCGETMKTDAP